MEGLLSISGIATGIDTDSLVEKIMAFEHRPVDRLQAQIKQYETVLKAWDNFDTKLGALRLDFQRLTTPSAFRVKMATSSNEDVLTASASSKAGVGTYTITVDQLAQSHQVASQGFASTTDAVGTGTFTVTVGKRSPVTITVDSSNNSLQGLADSINAADAGVTATVVNTGDATAPYKLLLTAEDTGSSNRIVVDAALSGGTAPTFGSVAAVVDGAKTGTSTVTSSGMYTGNTSGTITYTVRSGGTVGVDNITIDYDDGNGTTGSFIVPAGYTPGDTISVFGSVELSFSAGTLNTNDSFSTDVTSSTIQSPLDAKFSLGNSLGGASGIQLTSESNHVQDVVEGLTIDLHRVDTQPVTITVSNDTESIKKDVKQLVEQYNGFMDLIDEVFFVETDPQKVDTTKPQEVGALLGDRAAIDMVGEIQRLLTDVAQGVDPSMSSLADVGIRVNSEGRLELNEAELDAALADDPEKVMRVFATAGETTDGDIQFLTASADTVAWTVDSAYPLGYAVEITQAAERGRLTGSSIAAPSTSSPFIVDGTNDRIRVSYGGTSTAELTLTHGAYESGADLAREIQDKIDADGAFAAGSVIVRWVDDGGGNGHIEFETAAYGSTATVKLEDVSGSAIYSSIGHIVNTVGIGKDVQGTINGEAATGSGQILRADENNPNTAGLQLLVTISAAQLAAQGSSQGYVKVTKGIASLERDALNRMTDTEKGDVKTRKDAVNENIDRLRERVDRMEARLEIRRERLLAEFRAMEEAIAKLQNQQEYLAQALAGLGSVTPSMPTPTSTTGA